MQNNNPFLWFLIKEPIEFRLDDDISKSIICTYNKNIRIAGFNFKIYELVIIILALE